MYTQKTREAVKKAPKTQRAEGQQDFLWNVWRWRPYRFFVASHDDKRDKQFKLDKSPMKTSNNEEKKSFLRGAKNLLCSQDFMLKFEAINYVNNLLHNSLLEKTLLISHFNKTLNYDIIKI